MRQTPTRVIVATVVALAWGSAPGYAQEATPNPEHARLRLPLPTASPRAMFLGQAPAPPDRFGWTDERLRRDRRPSGTAHEWAMQESQPAPTNGGGGGFGGPLVWALVITASSTLGFLLLVP